MFSSDTRALFSVLDRCMKTTDGVGWLGQSEIDGRVPEGKGEAARGETSVQADHDT